MGRESQGGRRIGYEEVKRMREEKRKKGDMRIGRKAGMEEGKGKEGKEGKEEKVIQVKLGRSEGRKKEGMESKMRRGRGWKEGGKG